MLKASSRNEDDRSVECSATRINASNHGVMAGEARTVGSDAEASNGVAHFVDSAISPE
ncbi:MAG: fasciclin domain-containing protein [Blastocatellia bacterium]